MAVNWQLNNNKNRKNDKDYEKQGKIFDYVNRTLLHIAVSTDGNQSRGASKGSYDR